MRQMKFENFTSLELEDDFSFHVTNAGYEVWLQFAVCLDNGQKMSFAT